MKHIMKALTQQPWAITEDALELMVGIAQRNGNLEALEQKLGDPMPQAESARVRDGVSIIGVQGPLFRHANLFSQISGASSFDIMARDLRRAVDDDDVRAILLNTDSPGGTLAGTSEFAQQVRAARGRKPIIAFAENMMASAALWVGSAADRIVAVDTAEIGSVGVVMGIVMGRDDDSRIEIVSSNAPLKRVDPKTDAGRAVLQRRVDDSEQLFIAALAANRGVSEETVRESFGRGGVMVASRALEAGMIDEIGNFEDLIDDLSAATRGNSFISLGGNAMSGENQKIALEQITAEFVAEHRPEVAEALRAEGVKSVDTDAIRTEATQAERERISGIQAHSVAGSEDIEKVIKACIDDPECTPDQAAAKVLAKARSSGFQFVNSMRADERDIDPPAAGGEGADRDMAADIVALAQKAGAIPNTAH